MDAQNLSSLHGSVSDAALKTGVLDFSLLQFVGNSSSLGSENPLRWAFGDGQGHLALRRSRTSGVAEPEVRASVSAWKVPNLGYESEEQIRGKEYQMHGALHHVGPTRPQRDRTH